MKTFTCDTCRDTGKVEVQNGPDDFDVVNCPDCELGIKAIDDEGGKNDLDEY